jgi:Protein of unknown function (DUF4054)
MSGTGIVTFNYATWQGQYPGLAQTVNVSLATNYFNIATMYLDNSPISMVWNASPGGKRETILYMLLSHIAVLFATDANGQPVNPLVGRINSATQGSVSVQTDVGDLPFTAQWFAQTPYGFAAWQALAPYRTAMYVSPPNPNGYPGNLGYGYGFGTNPFGGGFGWPR